MMMKKLKLKLMSRRDTIDKIKFKSKDKVIILTGKDRGKISTILEIKKGNEFVKIENIRLQTHYKKDDGVNSGGLSQEEGWIHISNISHVTGDGKPTKVRIVKDENGKKKIFSSKTGEELRLDMGTTTKVQVEDKIVRQEKRELKKTQFEGDKKEKKAGVVEKKKKGDK